MNNEVLNLFDRIFGTDASKKIKLDNMPLLEKMYEYFSEDLFEPSEYFKKLKKQENDVSNKLEESFSEAQKELYIKQWELSNNMNEEMCKQAFMFGYIINEKLHQEAGGNLK